MLKINHDSYEFILELGTVVNSKNQTVGDKDKSCLECER
jgi:hypothetical protein